MSSADDDFQTSKRVYPFPYSTSPQGIPSEICVENTGDDELDLDYVKVENTLGGVTDVNLGRADNWPALSSNRDDQRKDNAVSSACLPLIPPMNPR